MKEPSTPRYKLVNNSFYGGKSLFSKKESPLQVKETFCCAVECTLRDAGRCICIGGSLYGGASCPFGKSSVTKGYTSRAQKYRKFRQKYEDAPEHNALSPVGETFFGRADGKYLFRHADVKVFAGAGGCAAYDTNYGSACSLDIGADVIDVLAGMLMWQARNWGKTTRTRSKTQSGPMFLMALRRFDEEMYMSLLVMYPELDELVMDPVGKKARLATLADGAVVELDHQKWTKKGNKLACSGYKAQHLFRTFATGDVELDIDPKYVIEVTSTEQVDEGTEYVD